ncbi:cation:proton antiporter subunit C [bacterium]|nr:cation:proton antiporter subunit C [bacterium]
MSAYLTSHGPYLSFVVLVALGAYMLLTHHNLLRALVGLYLIQSGGIVFFILLAFRTGGTVPILDEHIEMIPVNPLPHALMLTAIVVGVATLGVGLALLHRIQEESGHLEDDRLEGNSE